MKRYILIIETLMDAIGTTNRRLSVILVDTHKVVPVLDGTVAIESQSELERMVSELYGHDLKIIKP